MSSHILGIDFGTTKTSVAHIDPRTGLPQTLRLGRGTDVLPSTVAIGGEGQIFFGDEAEDMIDDPSVAYLRGFKMGLGSDAPLSMLVRPGGDVRQFKAQELVTAFLSRLRAEVQERVFMGEEVNEAVITRPVRFSQACCRALEEAAQAAGFTKVRLTTEPEAAGLAFCRLNASEAFKGNALVVDWGGGTLDMALVSRQGDRVVTSPDLTDGDLDVGGERFDERLWRYAEAALPGRKLHPITQMPCVRKAKEQLSRRESVTLRLSAEDGTCPPVELSRARLNELIADDVDKAVQKVQGLLSRVPEDMKPEMLLLLGGSSVIPLIREKLEAATGLPARTWSLSQEAAALGAALMPTANGSTELPRSGPAEQTADDAVKSAPNGFAKQPWSGSCESAVGRRRRLWLWAAAGLALLVGAGATLWAWPPAALLKMKVQASVLGDAGAQSNLGDCYLNGIGVEKDETEAVKWYRASADQGYAMAQFNIGSCYGFGIGVGKDEAEAVRWYRAAAEQEDAEAQNNLGEFYATGTGVEKDEAEAVRWYRAAAEQGDAEAQNNLAQCYAWGIGVRRDASEAVVWYRKAAEQRLAEAQYNLGVCYMSGIGFETDATEAAKWYREAAEQGLVVAQYNLGRCYADGTGVEKDAGQAVRWYREAAEQGLVVAQHNLGRCYANGAGVEKDAAQAVRWYRAAAEQGFVVAQYDLGRCYANGAGVEKDAAQAVRWYRAAAEQGYADAQNDLGACYESGTGVEQDTAQAVEWYRKAADQGHEKAMKALESLGVIPDTEAVWLR